MQKGCGCLLSSGQCRHIPHHLETLADSSWKRDENLHPGRTKFFDLMLSVFLRISDDEVWIERDDLFHGKVFCSADFGFGLDLLRGMDAVIRYSHHARTRPEREECFCDARHKAHNAVRRSGQLYQIAQIIDSFSARRFDPMSSTITIPAVTSR
jgi:hypothetical protein